MVCALAVLVAALEALHTAGSIDDLFLTGKERMTGRAQLHFHSLGCTTRLKGMPAGAGHLDALKIFRMYVLFHVKKPRKLINAQSVILP